MNIFKRTEENEKKFKSLIEKIDNINSKIEIYSKDIDISSIDKIKENFKGKTDDFLEKIENLILEL